MRTLAAWREHDISRAIHPLDREAIGATENARTLVLELLARGAKANGNRDLYTACARLGRLLADAGASPTLASTTIDGAAQALAESGTAIDPALLPAARASCVEGYVAAALESERAAARRGWDWPACSVRIDDERAAIACGFPTDDGDALGDWAARVATAAAKAGVRSVVLAGPDAAKTELESALSLVGIRIEKGDDAAKKPWLRLPWRK